MSIARIVIADDHALAREGSRAMLDSSARFDVVGEAASGEEALTLCQQHRPDLALLDIRYRTRGCEAGIDGLEAARRLSDTQPISPSSSSPCMTTLITCAPRLLRAHAASSPRMRRAKNC